MNCLISASASRAAMVQGMYAMGWLMDDNQEHRVAICDLASFFLHADDVLTVDCDSKEDALARLEIEWQKDRALRLILVGMSADEPLDIRIDAINIADNLFLYEPAREYVLFRLFSAPIPSTIELCNIVEIFRAANAPNSMNVLGEVIAKQESIRLCTDTWDAIPDDIFSDAEDRSRVRELIADTGAFFSFASENKPNLTLLKILMHPSLAGKAQARMIVETWAAKYKSKTLQEGLSSDTVQAFDELERPSEKSSHIAFERTLAQIRGIKMLLRAGEREKAQQHVDELVNFQAGNGAEVHVAKSLCNIAMFGKGLGDYDWHYDQSLRATMICPEDAWSFAQLGDALLHRRESTRALEAFDRAESLGDKKPAMLGKAEAFKLMGDEGKALELFDECIEIFPTDRVAANSKASALAYFGRLEKALDLYNAMIKDSMVADSVTYAGRSSVLKEMGNFAAAISDIDVAIYLAPDEVIARCAKVDILREHGDLDGALALVVSIKSSFPSNVDLESTHARVLRDKGDLDSAYEIYDRMRSRYPKNMDGHLGAIQILRLRGATEEVLEEYGRLQKLFPIVSRIAKNGIAATHAAMGNYDSADQYVIHVEPRTESEWVSLHIRGMIELRRGSIDAAMLIFEHGATNCPWQQQLGYFSSGLAMAFLRKRDAARALEEVRKATNVINKSLMDTVAIYALACANQRSEAVRLIDQNLVVVPVVNAFLAKLRNLLISANDSCYELFNDGCDMALALAA